MNILHKYFFLLFFCLSAAAGRAQVIAPDFLCVKGDSLFWTPASNTCGPFQAYTIYVSDTESGPYSVLASISDPNQLSFRHLNPTGQQWFYYLESDHDCPGQMVLQSDTLDNRSPEVNPISSLTVIGEEVLIEWMTNPSAEVSAYVIYRTTSIGTIPIDTVFAPITSYLDTNANPHLQSEAYLVVALDPCGNSSIFDVPHFTTFLSHTVDPCEQSILLSWNKYDTWANGIDRQEVWLSFDNGPLELVAILDSGAVAYTFENASKGHLYAFYIQAHQAGGNSSATSNTIMVEPELIQPIRDLHLKNATVTPANEVELQWNWNTDAELSSFSVLNAPGNNDYLIVDSQNPASPLQSENSYATATVDPSAGKQFLQIETTDLCESTARSDYASTIFLSGTPQADLNNLLEWTPYDVPGGRVDQYEVYRMVDGQTALVETVDGTLNTFSDPVDPTNNAESNVCYYLIATVDYEFPDGTVERLRTRSNQICVQQLSNIFVPNAFVPAGLNTRFKPVVVFSENVSYRMVILDRWGGEVFATTDIDEGWTGRNGLRLLPGGAYTYIIRVVQPDGMVVEKKGVVVMIR